MINNSFKMRTSDEIKEYIEYAFLDNTATYDEIKVFAQKADEYQFRSVVVGSSYIKYISEILENSSVKIVSVVDFPLGFGNTASRVAEAKQAIEDGADEIDMVVNIPYVKNGEFDKIKEDIDRVKEAIGDKILKVIIETTLITDKELADVCRTIEKTEAEFIKTCTGFSGVNNFNDFVNYLILIHKYAPSKKIKASGGIKNFKDINRVIASGATTVGTSNGPQIIDQLNKASENTEENAPGLFDRKPEYKKKN